MILPLLSQTIQNRYDRIRFMSERFSEAEPAAPVKFVAFIVCLVCVFLLIGMIYRIQRRKTQPKTARPMGLFLRMQAALNLPLLDRWHLWRLARATNIVQPAALLISETLFDEAVAAYRRKTGLSSGPGPACYERIRRRLFDTPAEDRMET